MSKHTSILEEMLARVGSFTKEASEEKVEQPSNSASAELEQLLNKEANTHESGDNEEMNKQAAEQGKALAESIKALLNKQASEGVPPVNETVAKQQSLVAEQTAETLPTPEGTTNQILSQLIARGYQNGAVDSKAPGNPEAATEGAPVATAAEVSPEQEKAAAVNELVQAGISFEDAVTLVKQAAAELDVEHYDQVKIAAINELMAEGVRFDEAVALVNQAK